MSFDEFFANTMRMFGETPLHVDEWQRRELEKRTGEPFHCYCPNCEEDAAFLRSCNIKVDQ